MSNFKVKYPLNPSLSCHLFFLGDPWAATRNVGFWILQIIHTHTLSLQSFTTGQSPLRRRRVTAMAATANQALRSLIRRSLAGHRRLLSSSAAAAAAVALKPEAPSSAVSGGNGKQADSDTIYVKGRNNVSTRDRTSVSMPMSFATGSIAGKRFYKEVTTRPADDGNGWTVMLDYRTLKTPSKRALKLPTLALAKAIAAEWEYQQTDGIRPFTMPLMKLACTALERVPLTRIKIIENLMEKFHQDLVFCRSPGDTDSGSGVLERQIAKIDPLLEWIEMEFGCKPAVYTSLFGGKQEDSLARSVEKNLKQTNDFELAVVDAMAAAAHSLVIPLAFLHGRMQIEEAVELIRLEEDFQIDRFGLVEGGHDVDIADLQLQISSAAVFLGLSEG